MSNIIFRPLHGFLLAGVLLVLIWSGISPHDRPTWILEVSPVLVGLGVLAFTWKRFMLTDITLFLIAIHMVILSIGGRYTYALVPIGDLARDIFELSRNPYDRLGHLAQGFVPAIIAREILLRLKVLSRRGWMPFLVVSICMGISACYELVEWAVAAVSGAASDAFLGTQGDVWDTQQDMAMALIGAVAALILLGRWHDRQMALALGLDS